MPELPEVETIRQGLLRGIGGAPPLPGQRITGASLRWPRHIIQPSISTFRRKIRNQLVRDVRRRAKYLLIPLERETLIVHLMMSGDLAMHPPNSTRGSYDHTVFKLESGWQLRFSDARKFGRVFLVKDIAEVLDGLGPEPLSEQFDVATLSNILRGRKRAIKPLLIDQSLIGGIGNIYADEALHRAKLHPLRRSDTLSIDEVRWLWKGIRAALKQGISHSGASIDWVYRGGEFQNHFRVYGRAGDPCPVCGNVIERIVVGQRGTHVCPNCQPLKGG
jgi:formamidopyrimidine-DNA glycosylase